MAALLEERAQRLETELAQARAVRELLEKQGLPRLLWVEAEFGAVLREAELGYVRTLIGDIASGALDGVQWWHEVYAGGDEPVWRSPLGQRGPGNERAT